MMTSDARIPRFSVTERMTHWVVALAFLYAALTGLALWSPRLFWLAAIFGGGTTVRAWHPWGGVLFVLFFAVMFRVWQRQMRLDRDDWRWLRRAHRYAAHDESGLPESGRFNGGQKALFWIQGISGMVLLLTGLVLWWPEITPRPLREISILLHPIAAVISIGGLIIHVYMGTAAIPGAFRGMVQGWVRPSWAASHHAKWYRQVRRG